MTAPHVDLTLSPHVLPAHTHAEYAPDEHTHSGYALDDHTHSGYAATEHTHSRLAPITGSAAGSFALNANEGADRSLTATANRTLTVSGGTDGQQIVVDVLASGGDRTITLSGLTLTTGIVAAWVVPSGKVGTIGLRRTNGTWRCLAQTVDQ